MTSPLLLRFDSLAVFSDFFSISFLKMFLKLCYFLLLSASGIIQSTHCSTEEHEARWKPPTYESCICADINEECFEGICVCRLGFRRPYTYGECLLEKHAHLVHVEDDDAAPPDFSPGVIAAIAIGASCLLAIITGVVFFFCRKRSASGQGSCNKVANDPLKDPEVTISLTTGTYSVNSTQWKKQQGSKNDVSL